MTATGFTTEEREALVAKSKQLMEELRLNLDLIAQGLMSLELEGSHDDRALGSG